MLDEMPLESMTLEAITVHLKECKCPVLEKYHA
jgi:hypothetical protein